ARGSHRRAARGRLGPARCETRNARDEILGDRGRELRLRPAGTADCFVPLWGRRGLLLRGSLRARKEGAEMSDAAGDLDRPLRASIARWSRWPDSGGPEAPPVSLMLSGGFFLSLPIGKNEGLGTYHALATIQGGEVAEP